MIKNILITGSSGQDGKIILNKLLKKKINLFLISRKKNKIPTRKNIKFFNINLNNKKKLNNFFLKNEIDVILHLASNNPSFGQNSYKEHYLNNIKASKNLIEISSKTQKKIKIIFCSSSRVFQKKSGIVNEKSKFLGRDHYSRFRIEIGKILNIVGKKNKNFKFINVILFNHDSALRNAKFLLPRIIKNLLKKNIIFLNKIINENIAMDFSHAEDICDGLIKLIFTKKDIKNIIFSSGKKTYVNDIIKYLIRKNKLSINLNYRTKSSKPCLIGNNNFAKKYTNWKIKKNIFLAAQELFLESNKTKHSKGLS